YNISILLCGTPYGYPSLARFPNLVASRVTGDTMWQGGLYPWQITTTLLRSFWWARAFNTPDPDAFNTNDMRGILAAAATGGVLYHGNDFTRVNDDKARLAWALKWDAPAIPENIAFCSNTIVVSGTVKGYRTWLLMNLNDNTTGSYEIMGLPSGCSVIKASVMCSIEDISNKFMIEARAIDTEMLIFYTGASPFPVASCRAVFIITVIVYTGPVTLLGVAIIIILRKKHFLKT
nr:hypothetical protein [Candidatus Sigynarchaeota archaeon]